MRKTMGKTRTDLVQPFKRTSGMFIENLKILIFEHFFDIGLHENAHGNAYKTHISYICMCRRNPRTKRKKRNQNRSLGSNFNAISRILVKTNHF